MDNHNEIDKAFQEAFGSFRPEVDSGAWQKINAAILQDKLHMAEVWRLRYRNAAVLLATLLAASLLWGSFELFKNNSAQKNSHNLTTKESIAYKTDTVLLYKNNFITDTIYLNRNIYKNQEAKPQFTELDLQEILKDPIVEAQLEKYFKEKNNIAFEKSVNNTPEPKKIAELPWYNPDFLQAKGIYFPKVKKFRNGIYEVSNAGLRNHFKLKEKIPLADRIYIQGLVSGQTGRLVLKNVTDKVNRQHGSDFGLFTSIDLSSRFWVQTGLSLTQIEFNLSPNGRITLFPENINNELQYVYRSPLGNLIIPNAKLSTSPESGSSIQIESHNDNVNNHINIPIKLNYDYLSKDVRFMGYYRHLEAYAGLGIFLQKPVKNSVSVEVYESDGSEFDTKISSFKGVSNLSFGGGIQTGIKLEIRPGWNIMGEFQAHRNFTYYVNNEYFRSYPQGIMLGGGIQKKLN